jgi:hypothetical protein
VLYALPDVLNDAKQINILVIKWPLGGDMILSPTLIGLQSTRVSPIDDMVCTDRSITSLCLWHCGWLDEQELV